MKTSLKLLALIAALPLASLNAAVLVQWGATGTPPSTQGATDIVTANQNYVSASTTYNGTVANNPIVGANYYTVATGRSPFFSTGSSGTPTGLVESAASGDRLVQYQSVGTGLTFRSMTVWTAANFLTIPTGLTLEAVSMNIVTRGGANIINAGVRVVVQQGANFYISAAQSFNNTFATKTFSLATETWYNFTPFASGVETIGSVATFSLADIEGVGFYTTAENSNIAATNTGSQISYFQATAVPEPGTWALLAVAGTLFMVTRRRRI